MASHITDYFNNANSLNSTQSDTSTAGTPVHLNVNNQENAYREFWGKKKRVLKVVTVERWINDDLAKDNGSIWLDYDADKQEHVEKLYCRVCQKYKQQLSTSQMPG